MARSQRLAKHHQDVILARVLKHAFEERETALVADRLQFARDVYADLYPPETLAQMAAMPAGFLPEAMTVRCRFGAHDESVSFETDSGCLRRIAHAHRPHNAFAKVYDDRHPLALRCAVLAKTHDQIVVEKQQAKHQARAVLSSVSTFAKLRAVWPEVESFLAGLESNEGYAMRSALSVPLPQLNQALRLPPQ